MTELEHPASMEGFCIVNRYDVVGCLLTNSQITNAKLSALQPSPQEGCQTTTTQRALEAGKDF